MAERAFERGVKVRVALNNTGSAIKRGVTASAKGVATAGRSTKDVAQSFWAGFKTGSNATPSQIAAPKTTANAGVIIVVSKI